MSFLKNILNKLTKPRIGIKLSDKECPHCNNKLEKSPGRKKKCEFCGKFMYVRTRPLDKKRVLVTEEQAKQIDIQWQTISGTR